MGDGIACVCVLIELVCSVTPRIAPRHRGNDNERTDVLRHGRRRHHCRGHLVDVILFMVTHVFVSFARDETMIK